MHPFLSEERLKFQMVAQHLATQFAGSLIA
jgi:hypothetical protein